MESFATQLEQSTKIQGHICDGQVIGVRMSMIGLAATSVNLETGKAVRIVAREESRELSKKYARQLAAYKVMPEEELFTVEEVTAVIPEQDLPGHPLRRVQCASCGDWVQDCRDIEVEGRLLCRGCAYGKYYQRQGA